MPKKSEAHAIHVVTCLADCRR